MTSKGVSTRAPSRRSSSPRMRRDDFRSTFTAQRSAPAVTPTRNPRLSISRSIRDRTVGRRRSAAGRFFLAAAACGVATPAGAHGFGQRYDLPLPLSLYLSGTAAAVVLSFVIVSLSVRSVPPSTGYPHVDLLAHPIGRLIARPGLALSLRLAALGLFAVTILAGFFGNQNPYQNIAPTMVWVIWWVGLAYVSAFAGDLWALVNPWRSIFGWMESAYGWITRRALSLRVPYPAAVGVWPAFFLLLAFSWIELVYPNPATPAHIAWLAL